MELTTFLKNHNIKIIAEIKYIEISSLNKKGARRVTRRQMDEYIAAYNEKFPNTFIIPLVITQNSYFNIYPDYPCMILLPRELKNVNLEEKIKEKIEENLQKISEHL